MKKFIASKSFIISVLCVLCVGVLVTCWIVSRDDRGNFTPEQPQTSESSGVWEEASSGNEADVNQNSEGTNTDQNKDTYPKVVEDNGQDVKIDFTQPQTSPSDPPEIPEGKTEISDPSSSHPVQKDPTVTPPKQKPSQSSTPAPGSKNEQGQVYDPVFGWVTVTEGVGIPTDNDGDIDKQVGTMGD